MILHNINKDLKDWERYSLIGYTDQFFEDLNTILSDLDFSDRERLTKLYFLHKRFIKFLEVCYVQKS